MSEQKILPNVVDMERSLLSAMLLNEGEIIPRITAMLKEEDFYRAEHRILFRTITHLYGKKIIPTLINLREELRRTGNLEKIGPSLLMSLVDIEFTVAYAENYASVIKEKSLLRRLIDAGVEITNEAYEDKKPTEEILENAEKKVFAITSQNGSEEFEPIEPILQRSFDRIRKMRENPDTFTGVATEFIDLDKITGGFQKSDLILLAARPSMGKTALALNMAMNTSTKHNKIVAVFSLEMSKEQLGHRLLASYSGVDSLKLNTGNMDTSEYNDVITALNDLSANAGMFIDDTAGISVLELRSKARQIKMEYGLDFIVIDYLQLMQGGNRHGAEFNRQQEISEISRNLKALARELKVPILALSQLSRSVELRADKRPMLSDLRESGSLEQDADLVMFLYREEYYNKESSDPTAAELIVAKNRNGPTSNIRLYFSKECMRFASATFDND